MLLTNPIWLWALAGLSIPISIHLLSRKEGQIIRIGSLRHLQETNTQQFKGIRLNEVVLLALRCSLIVLFVLMMSGLSFEKEKAAETKWLLIEKGLERLPEVQAQLDTFQHHGYEVRWLSAGFPLFDDSALVVVHNRYWGLVEQLQHEKADDIVVISKNNINSFKGRRPELPATIRWMSVESKPDNFMVKANESGDSILIRKGYSQPDKTYFSTQVVSREDWDQGTQLSKIDSIEVVIVSDKNHQYDKRVVEASLRAMQSLYPINVKIQNLSQEKINSNGSGNWCLWFSDEPVPDSIDLNLIYFKPGINQEIIVQEKPDRWNITKRLNEEVALNESFTVQLASLLLPSIRDWDVAYSNDVRMLGDESIWSSSDTNDVGHATLLVQSADSYLLIAFLLILLIERLLAYYRNQ
ncbi:MAG TPA: BatA domain-containing protein [Cyclobacteriaceae bacterium]|nr:BatA domain-containing protein [Cyclobacteriaceae bacterium]